MLRLLLSMCWLGLTHGDGSAIHQDDAVSVLQMGLSTGSKEETADNGQLDMESNETLVDSGESMLEGRRRRRRRRILPSRRRRNRRRDRRRARRRVKDIVKDGVQDGYETLA